MRVRAVIVGALLTTGSLLRGAALGAQEPAGTGAIAGHVTDARSGEPLVAVTIAVQGTALGALTGRDGAYRIARVPAGTRTIVARRIGYSAGTRIVAVSDGGTATADFALQTSAVNLQEVVVTGTAGNQTRVAQGAVVATLDAADVAAKAPVSTVTDVLQGRVAGVVVRTSSGTTGSAPRINIRGATSISLSNAPLIFIDGVRAYGGSRNDVGTYHNLEVLGGQSVTALNDVNPDDIESIEIVKGPAASTLYGADASAGVIQIITKRGRLGARRFSQNLTTEWNEIQPNFTPLPIYAKCSAAQVLAGGPALCQGLTAGSVISDNPLQREDVFHNGHLGAVEYNAQGGGDSYGYFVSASMNNEIGTSPSNSNLRHTGRTNFNWTASPVLSAEATVGLSRNDYRLPEGDDANYGYLTQQYALPNIFGVTVAPDGTRSGGLSTPVAGLAAVLNELTTVRFTPSAQVRYTPVPWFTNRLTLGADLSSTHGVTFFPPNTQNWYAGDQANGYVEDVQNPINIYTVDYLGNIHTDLHRGQIASDFSFGSQYINSTTNYLAGVGIGIATASSNLVSSASTTESHETYAQSKSLGLLAQEQLAFSQKLYLQAGARVDRNSAFGSAYGNLFLPKVSASYVISQEPFWTRFASAVSTLRLRAAYGSTGRSPDPGASLRTYAPFAYITPSGAVGPGVVQASPGNPNLKPERGTEFETGFDAGFFHERAGVELTFFDKRTSDLLLQDPLAPSLAYTTNPFINAGTVDNRGFEFTVRGTPVDQRNVSWDAVFTGSTLKNRLVSLGPVAIPNQSEISPDLTLRYTIGDPLSAWYSSRITNIDAANGFATVTATPVYVAPQFPTFTANLSNTLTLFRNVRLYALLTSQRGAKTLNVTPLYQDLTGTSGEVNLPAGQGGYSPEERIAHSGPFKTPSGASVPLVLDRYLQSTDFVRLQEVSAQLTLPDAVIRQLRAAGGTLTIGGRNLHVWKSSEWTGPDPELQSNTVIAGTRQFGSVEEFTVPPSRRWLVRLNLQF
ncbi:MAG TPA: SusC/RagA family TonB-linked outer membrane protein [Gemmatimonadaceae bacterium]